MAFEREQTRIPESIEDISIELYSLVQDDDSLQYGANFSVQVGMSTGEIRVVTGDLMPHLTQQQINSLRSFIDAMRTKAEQEILP